MTILNDKANSEINEKIEFWKNEYTCTEEQAKIYQKNLNILHQEMLKKEKEGCALFLGKLLNSIKTYK